MLLAQATAGLVALTALPAPAAAYTPHAPIRIEGNANFTAANGVTGGSGTPADPYVIEGWEINVTSPTNGIAVVNTDAHFVIRDVFVHSGGTCCAGLYLFATANARVENATVANNLRGMALEGTGISIVDNRVTGNLENGIAAWSLVNATFSGNRLADNRVGGLEIGGGRNITIARNQVLRNGGIRDGIALYGVANASVSDNEFSENNLFGVNIYRSANVTVRGNTFVSDGIFLDGFDRANFDSHTITPDNLVDGYPVRFYKDCAGLSLDGARVGQIIVADCTDVRITNVQVEGGDIGIRMAYTRDALIANNRVSTNLYGIYVGVVGSEGTDSNVTVNSNRMSSTASCGICLYGVDGAVAARNNASGLPGDGIATRGGQNVTITRNVVEGNNIGINLYQSATWNVTVSENLVSGNRWAGISAMGMNVTIGNSSIVWNAIAGNARGLVLSMVRGGVAVHHNSFENNTVQARDDGGPENSWDDGYPNGGNYWSDYAGVDDCSGPNQDVCPDPDGIGDTPYAIDADSQDRYPLMRPVFVIVIDTDPVGLSLAVDTFWYTAPHAFQCSPGELHEIFAPSQPSGGPDTRYVFLWWMEDGETLNPRTIGCRGPATYTAVYGVEHRVVLDTSPTGLTVLLEATPLLAPYTFWCASGTSRGIGTITPQYNGTDRYEFDHWSDGGAQNHTIACLPMTYVAFFLGPFINPPSVAVLSPDGGEDWTGGSLHLVTWTMSDSDDDVLDVAVNLSTDGGATFPLPLWSGTLATGSRSFAWTLPLMDAGAARVRVCATDSRGLGACDGNDADFAIDSTRPVLLSAFPPDGALTVDLNASIVLTFGESMNRGATEAAVSISPSPGPPGYGWDGTGRILTIEHAPFMADTAYTLTVGCGARDDSDPGNVLEGCPGHGSQVQFRTEIAAARPVAMAVAVTEARVGVPVTFDGSPSTGDITAWKWTVANSTGDVLATLDGAVVSYTFAEPGTHGVSLLVTDAYGQSDEYRFDVVVTAGPGPGGGPREGSAWILVVITAGAIATSLFAASEPGRVALATATVGRLYGRRPKDEKDSEIRGAILYYVRVHPGDAYMDIKRNLGLNDGAVTYHLARLEKEGRIRSAVRGARKRYYPAEMRAPLEDGGELHEIQQRILRTVAESPGMPVAVLAEHLGVSTQLALYHLRKLSQRGLVDLERRGLRLSAHPRETPRQG